MSCVRYRLDHTFTAAASRTTREARLTHQTYSPGRNDLIFSSQGHALAGHLYLPGEFDPAKTLPAVVYSGPFNQVKEQAGAVYGRALARRGYSVLVFDHLGYGGSEGRVRNNEHAFIKMEGIRDAISFVCALPFVDRKRVFGLGMCASGGYMALVATTDKRLNAIATVCGMMSNRASYFETLDRQTVTALIAGANAARQKYYETGEIDYVDALGLETLDLDSVSPNSAQAEGYDYYMTPRAGAETYPGYSHRSPGFMLESPMLADAMTYAPYLYTPYLGIYGELALSDTGSLTVSYYDAASEPKELCEVRGASHVSLYDDDEHVDVAVVRMHEFFGKHRG